MSETPDTPEPTPEPIPPTPDPEPDPVPDLVAQAAPRPGEYPQVLYHLEHGAKTVQTPEERLALGAGWLDHPPS